jgi:hypothetical protein
MNRGLKDSEGIFLLNSALYCRTNAVVFMSRVNPFFLILLALSSLGLFATLVQLSGIKPAYILEPSREIKEMADCTKHEGQHQLEPKPKIARALYNEAFKLSFNGQKEQALEASKCAALLQNGSTAWAYESEDFFDWLKLTR